MPVGGILRQQNRGQVVAHAGGFDDDLLPWKEPPYQQNIESFEEVLEGRTALNAT